MATLRLAAVTRRTLNRRWLNNIYPPDRVIARKPNISLLEFFRQAWQVLEPQRKLNINWHHELICEYLELVTLGEIRQLLINCPPRHLKSRIVSIAWPCWEWLAQPHLRYLCLSYSSILANDHNQDRRSLILSPWYQKLCGGMSIGAEKGTSSRSKNRIAEFSNHKRGQMLARGLDGSVTGVGGDRLVFDDPNNPEKTESEKIRDATLRKFRDYAITRRDDPKKTAVVVIQQRTHELDVSGWILKNRAANYAHICLPTEAEADQKINFPVSRREISRTAGEYLHASHFGKDEAQEAKESLGSYMWAARHQQRPSPKEGGRIKWAWFKRYSVVPANFTRVTQSWDTAGKAQQINDPWVGLTWGEKDGNYYLLDVFRRRMEFPEGLAQVRSLAEKWSPNAVLIEDKSSGQFVLQQLRQQGFRFSLVAITPVADKQTRMDAETPAIESGRVFLPESAPWLADYEAELTTFPNAAHDDQVDATSQFLSWMRSRLRGGGAAFGGDLL